MPDRGRDLTLNLISNANQFDLDAPAKQLEDVGDAAKHSGSQVEKAFKGIEQASGHASKEIKSDMRKAEGGLHDFKDEAHSSGKEAAASFSGEFSDVGDFIQEVAANAFGGFGAAGAAAGVAAAVGIGIVTNAIAAAKQRIQELADGLTDLKLDSSLDTTAGRIRQVLDTLRDQGELGRFRQAARDAGIDWGTYVRALAEGGPAADDVRRRLALLSDGAGGLEEIFTTSGRAGADLFNRLQDQAAASDMATDAAGGYQEGLDSLTRSEEDAAAAAERHSKTVDAVQASFDSMGSATDELTALVQDRAQKQADATKAPADSWEDYAATVKLSAADVIKTLDEQTKAAENWRTNLLEVQQRGDEEFLAWVAQQPPAVAKAYADGTAAQQQQIYDAFRRNVGARAAAGVAGGMTAGKPAVAAAAADMHAAAQRALAVPVHIPVGLSPPAAAAVASVRDAVRSAIGVLSVPVRPIVGQVYIPNQYAMRPIP